MVFQKPYQHQPTAIATYSFNDIADGTGNLLLYAAPTKDTVGTGFILTAQTQAGAGISNTVQAILEGNEASHDFDLSAFNTPRRVTGTAVVSFTCFRTSLDSTTACTLKRVRGADVTNISSTITTAGISNTQEILMQMPLTDTNFKVGDILRLTVDFNGTNAGQGIGIDPSGSATGDTGIPLKPFIITVPFRILDN